MKNWSVGSQTDHAFVISVEKEDKMAIVNRDILIPHLDTYRSRLESQKRKESDRVFSNVDENYKRGVSDKAAEQLRSESWKESDIGTGIIGACAIKAMQKHENLVGRFQVSGFVEKVKENPREAEKLLYDLYHNHNEQECFEPICELFGRKYDLIGYLYYILDPERYLPIRSAIFDEIFKKLDIDFQTTGRCSWGNYQEFLSTISEVRDIMRGYFQDEDIDLLDAHSFLWDIHSQEKEKKKSGEEKEEHKDPEAAEGCEVFHKDYGDGIIIKLTDEKIYVVFDGRQRIFPNPEAFERKYLRLL